MSSMSSTPVSRSLVMGKVPPRPTQRPPAGKRQDPSDARAAKTSAPAAFNRSSAWSPPVSTPMPWWKTWLMVTLANAVAVAVFLGLYTWLQSSDRSESRFVEPPRAEVAKLSLVNIRPMGLSSAGRSMPSSPSRGGAGSGAGSSASSASPSVDLSDPATLDGSNKLVLPSDVSGKCDIGDAGIKDFGRCLSQNGARPG